MIVNLKANGVAPASHPVMNELVSSGTGLGFLSQTYTCQRMLVHLRSCSSHIFLLETHQRIHTKAQAGHGWRKHQKSQHGSRQGCCSSFHQRCLGFQPHCRSERGRGCGSIIGSPNGGSHLVLPSFRERGWKCIITIKPVHCMKKKPPVRKTSCCISFLYVKSQFGRKRGGMEG